MHFLVSRMEWIGPEENVPGSISARLVTKSPRVPSSYRDIMLDETRCNVIVESDLHDCHPFLNNLGG
jgi:hypothetical protein